MINSRNLPFVVIGAICALGVYVSITLRCYTRVKLVRVFGWDDRFMVMSVVAFTILYVNVLIAIHYGTGQHVTNIPMENQRITYLNWYMSYLSYGISITLARTSIGLFFLRIIVRRWHRYTIIGIVTFNVSAGIIFACVVSTQCTPVHYFWNKADPNVQGHCIAKSTFESLGYLYGTICAVCDLYFVALPIHLLWTLDLNRRTKYALAPLLGMAGIGGVCPLIRMAYLHKFNDPDFFYATVDIALWSTAEPALAITASSLATLRPMFRCASSTYQSRTTVPHGDYPTPGKQSWATAIIGITDDEVPLRTKRSTISPTEDMDIEMEGSTHTAQRVREVDQDVKATPALRVNRTLEEEVESFPEHESFWKRISSRSWRASTSKRRSEDHALHQQASVPSSTDTRLTALP